MDLSPRVFAAADVSRVLPRTLHGCASPVIAAPADPPPAPLLLRPFLLFFRLESAGGILLLSAALVALVWANSPWAPSYFNTWGTHLTVRVGDFAVDMSLHHWINDGLMAVFFFLIGLELKRETLIGELASPQRAALSVAAALGGMAAPAAIYAALNADGIGADGWGIPMATDIAFALGVLALLGRRVPLALKIFVTAVAIVDDLGAVLVIALFYTAEFARAPLALAALVFIALLLMNRSGIRNATPYALLALVLWFAVLQSGVHATIAGVLVALTIPARRLIDAPEFLRRTEIHTAAVANGLQPGRTEPTEDQRDAIQSLQIAAADLETPLTRLEHALPPWVAFLVVPLFALANAGVALNGDLVGALGNTVTVGVVAGLVLGKQIGIVAFSWLAVRSGFATLPAGVGWRQIWGVAILCGIGFTMSLFIASLGFAEGPLLNDAKVGILVASLISGVSGALLLARDGTTHKLSES